MTFSDIRYTTYTGTDPQPGFVSLYVDTAADLPTVAAIQSAGNVDPLPGSTCVTCDDGKIYLLDSLGSWHVKAGELYSNVYTQAEVDALLAGKQDTLTIDSSVIPSSTGIPTGGAVFDMAYGVYYTGTVQANDDLNSATYQVPGRWRCSSSNAGTLTNSPYNSGQFVLDVFAVYNAQRLIQRIWIGGARYYLRGFNNGSFNHWFEYSGTDTGA